MTEKNGFEKVAPDFPDGVRIRYFDLSRNGEFAYMNKAAEIREYIRSLHNHFVNKGWLDRVRIIADEPTDIELYRKTINAILEEGPDFKFYRA